jgi:N-acetylmuramoyl-L-alanine amidase
MLSAALSGRFSGIDAITHAADVPGDPVNEADGRESDRRTRLGRRDALRLAAGAGAALAVAPHLRGGGGHAVDLGTARRAVANPNWPVPPLVTRGEWGADESIRKAGQEYDSIVEKVIVHHTATPSNPPDPAAVMRAIYREAVAGEYIDIQYNWLIDHNGKLYEGRWATDYPFGAPHTGEKNGANVRGGHALAHNSRTSGISFIGTYTDVSPPEVAVETLVAFLAWKCARWGIDPFGATPYTDGNGVTAVLANICGHRDTKPTTCPGTPLWSRLPEIRARVAARLRGGTDGYWLASADGRVIACGDLPDHGDTRRLGLPVQIVGVAAHPSGLGYWLLGRDGGIFSFGVAPFCGSTGGMRLNAPMIGLAPTIDGSGYWLVGGDGGVFSFGTARFFGSTGGLRLNAPVLGLCPTPSGGGYWLYARDGGIFSFGDAKFFGSTGGIRLARPIVSMAARPQGDGYWIVAEDGGIFSFGNAPFKGSGVGLTRSPTVDMIATNTGNGYALLTRDGGVYTFGDAPFFGSGAGGLNNQAVGIAGKYIA